MPVPTIFLVNDSGEFVEMADKPYDSEDLLQELLAKYPSVLAGDQMNGDAPVRWLLVAREAGVPCEEGGSDRWSLDHLFLDQNGIPTLVEVKRSTDTRIRREVVGQMLDYAANAVLYWPLETIRARFEQTCRDDEREPSERLAEFLELDATEEPDAAIAKFWDTVDTNLRAGKVRLVFVADAIPPELRHIVEFLNGQMNPAEVLAIEIRQYVGTGLRTLVPTVIGGSAKRAAVLAAKQSAAQWNRDTFLAALSERRGPDATTIATKLMDWADTRLPLTWWGEGSRDGSRFSGFIHDATKYYVFAMWTYGRIEMQLKWLDRRVSDENSIAELAARLNAIPGVQITPDQFDKRPAFDLMLLRDSGAMEKFMRAVEEFAERVRSA